MAAKVGMTFTAHREINDPQPGLQSLSHDANPSGMESFLVGALFPILADPELT